MQNRKINKPTLYWDFVNIINEICKIAVQQDGLALTYVPDNKKHLFIKNETNNI